MMDSASLQSVRLSSSSLDGGSEPPPDSTPQELSPPSPPPTEPVTAASGACACSYLDLATRANLAESLVLAACHAAILDAHGKPFSNPEALCAPFLKELTTQLLAPTTAPVSLPALSAALTAFVESKKGFLARFASEEALRAQALKLREGCQAAGAAWLAEADALAPAALRQWDVKGVAHCTARTASPEALAAHRATCAFRPTPCPHGCLEVLCAGRLGDHDGVCGFKSLPCTQGCTVSVRRREMRAHCAGPCLARPVECPFAHLGCAAPVTQGERDSHLEKNTALHLSLLATATAALGRAAEAQAPTVAEHAALLRPGGKLLTAVAAAAAAGAAASERAEKAERAAASAEREARSAQGDARGAKAEAAKAAEELRKLRSDFVAFRLVVTKELELDKPRR